MTHITYRGGVSIPELVIYVPALLIAVLLSIRHGFTHASGWRFLVVFALARILSSSFALALLSDLTNVSLNIGYSILINIALSPLLLTSFGLVSRIISDINTRKVTIVKPRMIQPVQIVVTVGLIIGIVGGDEAGTSYNKTGVYEVKTLTKASVVLFAICLAILVIFVISLFPVVSYAPPGEKRLLFAVAFSLPFLSVRLIYSLISVFSGLHSFSFLGGSETIILCMALLEEIVVVVTYESVGLTLKKLPKASKDRDTELQSHPPPRAAQPEYQSPQYGPAPAAYRSEA
ncbi:MAG: hypothetical protein M1828_007357 [Chrysothrix sp. TS-e1954]|nr:MAG: hypothetical protein M1828_007357 [Chrysothrix sp. TS-e1954]